LAVTGGRMLLCKHVNREIKLHNVQFPITSMPMMKPISSSCDGFCAVSFCVCASQSCASYVFFHKA